MYCINIQQVINIFIAGSCVYFWAGAAATEFVIAASEVHESL